MPRRTRRIPKLCHHKASGQAVVRLDRKDHYLGPYGTAQAQIAYHRKIAEWLATEAPVADDDPPCTTIAELCAL